jgi:hypothetical protein
LGDRFDLLLTDRRLSLGRLVHCEAHEAMGSYRGAVRVPWRSSSIVGGGTRLNEEQPADELADAVDKHMGRGDWWLLEVQRLEPALERLWAYSPPLERLVSRVCIEGRTSVIPGWRVKHHAADLLVERPPFNGEWRKLQRWMRSSWELIGLLAVHDSLRERAIAGGFVPPWALRAAQERGWI